MKITRKMVETEYLDLKARYLNGELRYHDVCSIKALHPYIKVKAAACFLNNDIEKGVVRFVEVA